MPIYGIIISIVKFSLCYQGVYIVRRMVMCLLNYIGTEKLVNNRERLKTWSVHQYVIQVSTIMAVVVLNSKEKYFCNAKDILG